MCAFKNLLYDIKAVFYDGQVLFFNDIPSVDVAYKVKSLLLICKKIEIKKIKGDL